MVYILTTLLFGALIFAVLYFAPAYFVRNSLAQRHGCQLPPRRHTRDPILGIDCKIQDSKSSKELKTLPAGAALHRQYGSTYRETTIFGTTIKTADEENIHTVFGLKAKDWGVGPYRFAGMGPFCGEGFISTDGAPWARSRALLKPSFHKSNISDLTTFEHSVSRFLAQIPRDASTINLEELIAKLVCLASSTHA